LKLLRFLQEKEVRPLARRGPAGRCAGAGGHQPDVQKMVEESKFREDLWFRLNVVRVKVPPLRERRGDVGCWPIIF